MALKQKITKEVFDKLSEDVKKEYKSIPGDDANYVLDLEGYEDPGELRRAKQRESDEKKVEKARADKAEADLAELRRVGARENNDVVALEASWKATADSREAAAKAETKAVKAKLTKVLRDDVARTIAASISTKPNLILPHILARLKVEIPEGDADPLTRVIDKEGKPSALSVAELEKEFIADADFADIIIASRASGGGAAGNQSGGATKKPSDYTGSERIALFKSNRAEHDRLFPPVN